MRRYQTLAPPSDWRCEVQISLGPRTTSHITGAVPNTELSLRDEQNIGRAGCFASPLGPYMQSQKPTYCHYGQWGSGVARI